MSVLPDRQPDVTRTLRRAHPLTAQEETPVPFLEDGTIVPETAISHVDVRVVAGGLNHGDRVELVVAYGGDRSISMRHGATHGSHSQGISLPERQDPADGEPFASTWSPAIDTEVDDGDDDDSGLAQLGADASVAQLSLPFPLRAGQPLTITAWTTVDATLLPVTVLPETDEEVRTELRLWRDDEE